MQTIMNIEKAVATLPDISYKDLADSTRNILQDIALFLQNSCKFLEDMCGLDLDKKLETKRLVLKVNWLQLLIILYNIRSFYLITSQTRRF